MFLIFLILIFGVSESVLSASPTRFPDRRPHINNNNEEYQDSLVMSNLIGSGGLNFQHYFYTLGVACENRNPGFWNTVDKNYRTCETLSRSRHRKRLPHGFFKKSCSNWKVKRQCKVNLALDLDDCFGNKKGSNALRFMDAYVEFTCGNSRNAEAHTVDRFTKRGLLVPGVFRCFPHLQDRISNCVTADTISNTFCSQFYTVAQCYGAYYREETCNDAQSIIYMRDLFNSMSANLKCPQTQEDWHDKDKVQPVEFNIEQPEHRGHQITNTNRLRGQSIRPYPKRPIEADRYILSPEIPEHRGHQTDINRLRGQSMSNIPNPKRPIEDRYILSLERPEYRDDQTDINRGQSMSNKRPSPKNEDRYTPSSEDRGHQTDDVNRLRGQPMLNRRPSPIKPIKDRYIPTSERPGHRGHQTDDINRLRGQSMSISPIEEDHRPSIGRFEYPFYKYSGRGPAGIIITNDGFISSTRPPAAIGIIEDRYIYIPTTIQSNSNNNINGILRPVSARPYRNAEGNSTRIIEAKSPKVILTIT